jgi:hypothetical protein
LSICLNEEFQITGFDNNENKLVNKLFEGLIKKARPFHKRLHTRYASQIEQTPDEVQQKDGKRFHKLANREFDRHYVIIN